MITFDACNLSAVRSAARKLTRFYNAHLTEVGTSGTQFPILRTLASEGPSCVAKIADVIGMDRTTMSRNLAPLIRDGLVVVSQGEHDRRERTIELTARGESLLIEAEDCWSRAQKQFEGSFGTEQAAEMRRIMADVVKATLSAG